MTRIPIREEDGDILLALLWAENDERLQDTTSGRDIDMTDQDIIRTLKASGLTIRTNNVVGPEGRREIAAVRPDTLSTSGAQVIVRTPSVYLTPAEFRGRVEADIRPQGRRTEYWTHWDDIRERIGRL